MRALLILALLVAMPSAAHAQDPAQDAAEALMRLIEQRDALAEEAGNLRLTVVQQAIAIDELKRVQPTPKDCDVVITHGTQIPWARAVATPGVSICLPDGGHAFVVAPPRGLAGATIRAVNYGKATVQGIELVENAVTIWGLRVVCDMCPGGTAIWSRMVAP